MIYIDLDADLNMEDDTGRNFTLVLLISTVWKYSEKYASLSSFLSLSG